jgi:hypothetical protein
MRSNSKKPKLRTKGGNGMSEPRFPSDKSVEVVVTLRAYRDQAGIVGSKPKPGFSLNGQVESVRTVQLFVRCTAIRLTGAS